METTDNRSQRARRERRRSDRRAVAEEVTWRVSRRPREYRGIVVERSLTGFLFLADSRDAPPPDAWIMLRIRRRGHGPPLDIRSAVVRRTDRINEALRWVAAEIES